MQTRVLRQAPAVRAVEHRCSAGPADRPFEEEHLVTSISLVLAGAFRYRCAAGTVALGPGTALLGNRGDRYVCSHELGQGDHCLAFFLDDAALDGIASHLSLRGAPRFRAAAAPPTHALAGPWAVAVAAATGDAAAISVEEAAYELAAAVLTAEADRRPSPGAITARDQRRAADAMRWLDERADEPIALADTAAAVGLGPFHFLRVFHRTVGVTPHQYLVAARLRRAAAALVGSDRPITAIAYDSGFGDLSNFIRTFRRATGASPRVFRARGAQRVGGAGSRIT